MTASILQYSAMQCHLATIYKLMFAREEDGEAVDPHITVHSDRTCWNTLCLLRETVISLYIEEQVAWICL